MDMLLYKIALAGYMHDIGKFAERAKAAKDESSGLSVDDTYLENNRMLYQPYYKNRFTHAHALFTAYFIEKFGKYLPSCLFKSTSDADSFINLSAKHHRPESPLQWIVAVADRVSSGFDRTTLEVYDEIERDYRDVRLIPIFESINLEGNWKQSLSDYKFRYPMKKISPKTIFPTTTLAEGDYKEIFTEFINELKNLKHKEEDIQLWFENFDSLCMLYLSHIPSSTLKTELPDISLYDHMRVTSALSVALYKYHKETDTITEKEIKDYETKKFLLLTGDFYGIQDFIFSAGGSTSKASAKILRGRSFYVSLLIELASDMLCRVLGLPFISSIYNAAGKFTLILPNTDNVKKEVETIEKKINDWLIEKFYGTVSIGFATVSASCEDFVGGKFINLSDAMAKELEKRKYSKFHINRYSGVVSSYLDSFNNELGICRFCGIRPANMQREFADEHISSCSICRDQIFIGENLVKKDTIAVIKKDANITERETTLEPIFEDYKVSFSMNHVKELIKDGKLLRLWHIGEIGSKGISIKFLKAYVPVYEESDLKEENIDRILAGKKSDKLKNELFDSLEAGIPKTFSYLAKMALEKSGDDFTGIEALGVLKADVDNLGAIFSCGLREDQITISRIATMSRQLNNFFVLYLPYLLKKEERFKDIYTVFAGGDDLLMIGPWNRIIEFVGFISEKFKEYVCYNPALTISAGISIHKPNTPVPVFEKSSEEALRQSKRVKNAVTVFNETVSWDKFKELEEIRETIEQWFREEFINKAMLYRVNEITHLRKREIELLRSEKISYKDMNSLMWYALLYYTSIRNIAKKLKGEQRQNKVEELLVKFTNWIKSYSGAFKIPLWQIIYKNRK